MSETSTLDGMLDSGVFGKSGGVSDDDIGMNIGSYSTREYAQFKNKVLASVQDLYVLFDPCIGLNPHWVWVQFSKPLAYGNKVFFHGCRLEQVSVHLKMSDAAKAIIAKPTLGVQETDLLTALESMGAALNMPIRPYVMIDGGRVDGNENCLKTKLYVPALVYKKPFIWVRAPVRYEQVR